MPAVWGPSCLSRVAPELSLHDHVKARDLSLCRPDEAQNLRVVAALAICRLQQHRTGQASVAESKLHLPDFLTFPPWEAPHRTVIQVAARDPPLQAVGHDAARQRLVLFFPDPEVVAPD